MKPTLILAFPGMGKTPLAKSQRGWLDLDFGHYREAHRVRKEEEGVLIPSFLRLVERYTDEGWKVVSNEPKLIPSGRVSHAYLPKDPSYSAKKMKVSEEQVSAWIADWERECKKFHVPVTYINVGLDHYLRTPKLAKGQ